MSDEKITQLTADTAPTTDDLAVIVNDPAGTPGTKKVTLSNLFTVIWAAVTNAATAKTTPVDADLFSIVDTAASNVIKKLSFFNLRAFLNGFTTTATAAGTTTLTVASTLNQVFTGATTQTITLPVVSTLHTGFRFNIYNESTGALTINSSGGNLVRTLPAGAVAEVVCILITGTTAASWYASKNYSGTYTPTLTNGTNVAASTSYLCQYMRVGNVVTVSGKVDIDTTAAAFSELGMSLPIASALAATHQVGGVAKLRGTAADCGSIEADTTNDRASLNFNSTDTANRGWYFTFTYLIV